MRFAFLVPAALLLTGCGSNDFTCSSATVIEKLTAFYRDNRGAGRRPA